MPWWNEVNDENMLHVNAGSLMFHLSFWMWYGGAPSGIFELYVYNFLSLTRIF